MDLSNLEQELKMSAPEYPFIFWTRDQLLASPVPRLCGLDLYWTCVQVEAALFSAPF